MTITVTHTLNSVSNQTPVLSLNLQLKAVDEQMKKQVGELVSSMLKWNLFSEEEVKSIHAWELVFEKAFSKDSDITARNQTIACTLCDLLIQHLHAAIAKHQQNEILVDQLLEFDATLRKLIQQVLPENVNVALFVEQYQDLANEYAKNFQPKERVMTHVFQKQQEELEKAETGLRTLLEHQVEVWKQECVKILEEQHTEVEKVDRTAEILKGKMKTLSDQMQTNAALTVSAATELQAVQQNLQARVQQCENMLKQCGL